MLVKCKCEGLGDVQSTKKGGYVRKFLVEQAGKKEVVTQYCKDKAPLAVDGVHDRVFVTGDFFFSPE